jgi:AcrR family transcriptional regulator
VITALYDPDCRICRASRRWLEAQWQLVRLELVAAGSTGSGCERWARTTTTVTRVEEPVPQTAAKGEQTRALIVETALRLFTEKGFDRTTMRAIAADAGVSVGNAYYYFSSKEHLIQGFYDRITAAHRAASAPILAAEQDFSTRLRDVLLAWVDVAEPYHSFATEFFKNAADPTSPLSPLSAESAEARELAIALHREVLEGSPLKVDPELRADLPQLLWLYHMGVVLFWVHDRSADRATTRMLIRRSAPMVGRLLQLSRLRVFRSLSREAMQLSRDIGWFPATGGKT